MDERTLVRVCGCATHQIFVDFCRGREPQLPVRIWADLVRAAPVVCVCECVCVCVCVCVCACVCVGVFVCVCM